MLIAMLFSLSACYELNEGSEEDYTEAFAKECEFVSLNSAGNIVTDSIKFSTFYDSEEDEFYVEKRNLLDYKPYLFLQIKASRDVTISEMSIYSKWKKSSSGENASSKLEMNFYTSTSSVEKDPQTPTLGSGHMYCAGDVKFSKESSQGSLKLVDKSWGDGELITFSPNIKLKKNEYFIVAFRANIDYLITGEEGSETISDIDNNDQCFIIDKVMFRIEN